MAVTTCMTDKYREDLFMALHDHTITTGHTFRVVLFKAAASVVGTYNKDTEAYTDITGNSDENTASGYTAKGEQATNVSATHATNVAFVDFSNTITYSSITMTSSAAAIMNDTHASDRICSLHDFGGDKTASGGDFVIDFPAADASNAILRLA